MATPFLSEIRIFGFNFAPVGWAFCSGQILSIAQNTALFSLLGTTYGGNGTQTFALPDLRGRTPAHQGSGLGLTTRVEGEVYGTESVTLLPTEIPQHTHTPMASSAGATATSPSANVWAAQPDGYYAYASGGGAPMQPAALATAGGSQPHENRQPYLVLNFCIALTGVFPSRN